MTDPQSQLIGLLERLSVAAPERCGFILGCFHARLDVYGDALITNTQGVNWYAMPELLMAVLEEAEARGWEWNYDFSKGWELLGDDLKYFEVGVVFGGVLEREVLPRLECLVLALEAEAQQ